MANISVIVTVYVGLVSGACLSDFGHTVICVDKDNEKIEKLRDGIIPIYEPGLTPIVEKNLSYKRLSFSTDTNDAVNNSDVVFIAVGTPAAEDGSADLRYVEEAARTIASVMEEYKVIVNKSTVPLGTGRLVKKWGIEELTKREKDIQFDVVSNPEFLREGSAIHDFTHPDRVVIGAESERAILLMKEIYQVLYINETPFIITGIETAEMIKYASNAFLAVKITFINEIANLCEKVGADVKDVARAMGKDGRIGSKFLHPGPGYGGSCFPKDTRALADIADKVNSPLKIVRQTIESNERQKHLMGIKILSVIGSRTIVSLAVLGLAFKPNTNDMRESPSLDLIYDLSQYGIKFSVYDPEAMEEGKWRLDYFKDKIKFAKNEYDAVNGADAVVIMTEWNQFRNLDLGYIKKIMKGNYFFDFRNIYNRKVVESQGFIYTGVGV